jgi:predicted nucleic acid-binding protein
MDDLKARRLATNEGLEIRGTVGILEQLYRHGEISDLRAVFEQLVKHAVYIDRALLNQRLQSFGLEVL